MPCVEHTSPIPGRLAVELIDVEQHFEQLCCVLRWLEGRLGRRGWESELVGALVPTVVRTFVAVEHHLHPTILACLDDGEDLVADHLDEHDNAELLMERLLLVKPESVQFPILVRQLHLALRDQDRFGLCRRLRLPEADWKPVAEFIRVAGAEVLTLLDNPVIDQYFGTPSARPDLSVSDILPKIPV